MVLNPTVFLLKYLNLCLEELYRQHTIENTQQVFGQRGSSSCTTACTTAWRSQKIKFFCLCLLFCNPSPLKTSLLMYCWKPFENLLICECREISWFAILNVVRVLLKCPEIHPGGRSADLGGLHPRWYRPGGRINSGEDLPVWPEEL